jgi:hypothetical protein
LSGGAKKPDDPSGSSGGGCPAGSGVSINYNNTLIIKIMTVESFITQVRDSFDDSVRVYTEGSCLHFYLILKEVFPNAKPWLCEQEQHIYTEIDGKFYDIRGAHERDKLGSLEPLTNTDGRNGRFVDKCRLCVPIEELVRRFRRIALLDPYGKLHYYYDYCRIDDAIDESGNVLSGHEAIARKLMPDSTDPLTGLWKMGWAKYIGWMSCSDSPAFYKEPTQAQINTMYELEIKKYSVLDMGMFALDERLPPPFEPQHQ